MRPMNYGKYRQSIGGVPAGGDQSKLSGVFTAMDKPMLITAAQFYGGDASEYYTIVQIPPGAGFLDATLTMSDIPGAIVVTYGNIEGGGTEDSPQSFLNAFQSQSTLGWLLPPYYSLAVMPVTAASTAAFVGTMGGFELA